MQGRKYGRSRERNGPVAKPADADRQVVVSAHTIPPHEVWIGWLHQATATLRARLGTATLAAPNLQKRSAITTMIAAKNANAPGVTGSPIGARVARTKSLMDYLMSFTMPEWLAIEKKLI